MVYFILISLIGIILINLEFIIGLTKRLKSFNEYAIYRSDSERIKKHDRTLVIQAVGLGLIITGIVLSIFLELVPSIEG